MQYNRFRLLYTIAILYTTFSLLNAMLLKKPETFYRGCGMSVSEMTVRINNGESSPEEVAAIVDEWIAANQDTIDGWLETARAAAQ